MTAQVSDAAAAEVVVPDEAAPRRRAPRERPWKEAASLAAGAVLWEIVGRNVDAEFFPPLSDVLVRLWELILSGAILVNLGNSLANFALAFTFCIVVGVPVGMLMGIYPRVHHALDIYVNALLTAPALIFAPIFFALFGLSRWAIIAVIVMYSLFIIIVSAEGAVRSVDPALREMAASFNASRGQAFVRILLPASVPLIMAGLRLGAGRGVKGMINGEMFIAAVGLGALIMSAGRRFDSTTVLAVLLVIIVVALGVARFIQWLDGRLTSWLPSTDRKQR